MNKLEHQVEKIKSSYIIMKKENKYSFPLLYFITDRNMATFLERSNKKKDGIWVPFLNLRNKQRTTNINNYLS